MRVVGAGVVIIGGLVAAVTGPLYLTKGSWAAAYLVLVAGAAQVAMGSARQRWQRNGSHAQGWAQFALWNLGNVAVIAGTAARLPAVVVAGSLLLVAALVLAFLAMIRRGGGEDRMLMLGYCILLVMLAVSIPIGVVLSAIRNA